ncbi:MAG: capsid cement protein [Rubripirellula sp.]
MAAKFQHQGGTIKAVAAAAVSNGTMVSLGPNLMGVAVNDAAIGQEVAYRIDGIYEIDTDSVVYAGMTRGARYGVDFVAQEVIAFPGAGNPSVVTTEMVGSNKANYKINMVAT